MNRVIAADESTSQLWASPAWRTEAIGWLDRQLTAAELARMAEPQQPRIRAWFTLLRFPVDAGFVVWMKACAPPSAYEAALVQLLGRHAPGSVVPPIAVDVEPGWMPSPDAGQVFRERVVPGAMLVGRIGRVLGWRRAMAHATDGEHEQWDEHPRRWLAEVRDGMQPPPAH